MLDEAERLGWGDGLPFIPPTRERIERMLEAACIDPEVRLPDITPSESPVTAAKIAANAVMAGCRSDVFPIVFTAMKAILQPGFNHEGMQSTTHPTAPLVIVHGPIAKKAGFNAGSGTLGPGVRANATVGRAIRLALLNIGHGRPGDGDYATQGSPAKYSYCMAENADESPWPPYHVECAGLDPDQSAVTVMGAEGPHHVNDHVSLDAPGLLHTVGSMVTVCGSNTTWLTNHQTFIVLGPEHAATVAKSKFTRRDVQYWLYENARMPLSKYKKGGMWGMEIWPRWKQTVTDDDQLLCPLDSPESFKIIVGGGAGKNSAVIPGDGMTRCPTLAID
ncbi:MAG: hypothetical protein ABS81_10995 [Pseudonocardia sp. SCN 72-86]|nr:MAG: hypothetical protein ABS81_10995 [Pseudonocardia sp. SCN 72-86]